MLDHNAHLSGEIRRLNFQKSMNQGMWQDSIRQQQANETGKRLGMNTGVSWLTELSNSILLHISLWKQRIYSSSEEHLPADRGLTDLGTKATERR